MPSEGEKLFKTCRTCGEKKPATTDYFVKKLNYLTAHCKPCLRAIKRADWEKNADKYNAARRSSRGDRERLREREWYTDNKDRVLHNRRRWRAENPEKLKEAHRRHYKKFADKKKKQAKEWAAKNPDRKRKNTRDWYRMKRKNDPMYRLRSSVSAYIYWCLKSGKDGKRTEDILGFTMDDLRVHLEKQFLAGMDWENYGEWHVDHILPVSSFQYESADDPEFQACWALSNLRPLWAKDNLAKNNHRTHLI